MLLNPSLIATDVPPIPAAQRWAAAYNGRHGPLIDLAQAVPGHPPPAEMLERLGAAAASPQAASYGPILGDATLREALATDIAGLYGATVGSADLAITAGCNQAFFVTVLALARAGDEIILPTPWYFNHKMTLDMLGIRAQPLPCRAETGFVPRVEDARALIGATTRAIVLVTPNNPTGAVYPAQVLREFQDLARETSVALVIDETYRDFLPAGMGRPHELFTEPHWRDTTIQLYSFSKSYAMPGHRLGAILAGNALLDEITKVLDSMQICAPRAAQMAATWAINGIRDWREEVRAAINKRAALFRHAVAGAPGWDVSAIGAYFAYVRHPFAGEAEPANRLAREAGVLALPGSFFGPGQEDHLRIAFANVDDEKLAALAERLRLVP